MSSKQLVDKLTALGFDVEEKEVVKLLSVIFERLEKINWYIRCLHPYQHAVI